MNPPDDPSNTHRQLRSRSKRKDKNGDKQIETGLQKPQITAWARDETPSINSKFTAPIYNLKVTIDENYTFEQAPNAINSYYVQLEARHYQQQLCTYAKCGTLYLPIAFLRALANNDVHWERLLQ
jgi:hypothetical protein